MKNTIISPDLLEKAFAYEEYVHFMDELLAQGKTTGNNQSEEMVHYTRMNRRRMERIHQIGKIEDELRQLLYSVRDEWYWVVLTEPWCGDAAQNVPFFYLMTKENPRIELRLWLRDEHPEVMDHYLTNGGRAIPKLICIRKSDWEEMGTWGPRPQPAQEMVTAYKANPTSDFWQFAERLHKWYADDKGAHLQAEMKRLITAWAQGTPASL